MGKKYRKTSFTPLEKKSHKKVMVQNPINKNTMLLDSTISIGLESHCLHMLELSSPLDSHVFDLNSISLTILYALEHIVDHT